MTTTNEKLDKLLADNAAIKTQLKEVHADVQRLNRTLYIGNGKPSVISRLELAESQLDSIKWFRRLAVGGMCSGLIGVIVLIIGKVT